MALTFQSGLKSNKFEGNSLEKYSLFLGGLNVTRQALEQYDPLRTGFGRIFMIRGPKFLMHHQNKEYGVLYNKYKHIIEYGNTGVSGNGNITMNFNTMQGGYTNREMEIPNIASDDSKDLTIKVYEFSGSPVREFTQLWINGVSDIQSGFSHYYGYDGGPVQQSNHTAEFIYVVTDPSGLNVEYAALFANCFPKEVRLDQFNYDSGNHDLVQLDLTFSATRYMSPQINYTAARLIKKYNVMMNSLYFNGGAQNSEALTNETLGTVYNPVTGQLLRTSGDINTHVAEIQPNYNSETGDTSHVDIFSYNDKKDTFGSFATSALDVSTDIGTGYVFNKK